jgi:GAF domain-containing protein
MRECMSSSLLGSSLMLTGDVKMPATLAFIITILISGLHLESGAAIAGRVRRHHANAHMRAVERKKKREERCSTTLCQSDLLIVPDLRADDRFRELSYVAGEPYCRFYAGMPLINPEGYALGTLCVVDFKPRQMTFAQAEAMRRLSRQVVAQLELRRNLLELKAARETLTAEMRKAKDLLLNILPAEIADELEREKRVEPRYYASVTIMFTDFKELHPLRREPGAPQAGGRPQSAFLGIRRDRRSSWP